MYHAIVASGLLVPAFMKVHLGLNVMENIALAIAQTAMSGTVVLVKILAKLQAMNIHVTRAPLMQEEKEHRVMENINHVNA